ncbi:MAG: UvrB/UvrC motif-containing protein, partial [Candidatus Neomarinimicrobiota bacterium]|nr:UvrB/UvrC motif-containing protein [Candidatus Neomarinimicrobiota bacterium]
ILGTTSVADSMGQSDEIKLVNKKGDDFSSMDKKLAVEMMRQEMIESAENLEFEKAAKLRDEIDKLEEELSKIFN